MKTILTITTLSSVIILGGCVSQKTAQNISPQENNTMGGMEISAEHCAMMPDMAGCEGFTSTDTTTSMPHTMDHSAMVTDALSFISEMIPHHQEAVDSSTILLGQTQNTALKSILENIISGQDSEITMMKNRLSDQYSGLEYRSMYMLMMRDTTGINDVKILEKMYMEDMILHHQGAVDMAEKLLAIFTAQDPLIRLSEEGIKHRNELKAFAQAIIETQTEEIEIFEELLKAYN